MIDRFAVVAESPVVPAVGEEAVQCAGQFELIGNLPGGVPGVGQTHGLVVDVLVEIPLLFEEVDNLFMAPDGPVVAGKVDVGCSEAVDGLIDVAAPFKGVAHLGTAQGVKVVHVVGDDFGPAEGVERREIEGQFGRRFRFGRKLEDEAHPVDHDFLGRAIHLVGRRQNAELAEGNGLAQPRIHIGARRSRQVAAELVGGASSHGDTGNNVFAGRFGHEAFGGDDRYLALGGLGGRNDAQYTAEMIDMAVGKDDGHHGAVGEVLHGKGQGGGGGFPGGEGIDDDPTGCACDEGHVGEIETAQLVDAGGDFEQTVDVVQLRLTPQTGIDAGRRGAINETESIHVPNGRSCGVFHLQMRRRRHQPAPGVLEIPPIVERELLPDTFVHPAGHLGGGAEAGSIGIPGGFRCAGGNDDDHGEPHGDRDVSHGGPTESIVNPPIAAWRAASMISLFACGGVCRYASASPS